MAWFKVDDGFANSKPVLRIPRRYRTQAIGLWVMAGTWCAKELTDGHVPEFVLEDLASTSSAAEQLVRAGLWENAEGGWQFVGWSKYQFTKEQVMNRREEEANRKQRAREAKRKTPDQQEPDDVRNMSQRDTMRSPHDVRAVSALPDQTRPDQTHSLSLVTSSREVALVDAHEPPTKCSKHINDISPPACPRCGDARKANEAWNRQQRDNREAAKQARKAAIEACTFCDERGMVEIRDNEQARCCHQAVAHA